MKNERKHNRMESLITTLAGEFFSRERVTSSLLTVTRVVVSDDLKCATIFFTAYPPEHEKHILTALTKKAGELQ